MIQPVTSDRVLEFRGLSTDTKPTRWPDANGIPLATGSIFFEEDTSNVFMFDSENQIWREI